MELIEKMKERLRQMGHGRIALIFERALSVMQDVGSTLANEDVEHCFLGGIVLPMYNYDRPTGDIDVLISGSDEKTIERVIKKKYMEKEAQPDGTYVWYWGNSFVPVGFVYSGRKYHKGEIAFPEPNSISVQTSNGTRIISLERLIMHKLDSGKNPLREKDLADVNALIRLNRLGKDFGKSFPPALRREYQRRWDLIQKTGSIKG